MRDLDRVVARRRLGLLSGADLVTWATEALSSGRDSSSLVRLASLDLGGDVRLEEAETLFLAALDELAVPPPDESVAVRTYVRSLAREIVDGSARPQEQVARIHREILSPLDHPSEFMVWCYVGDNLRPREWSLDADAMVHFQEIPQDRLDDAIRDLAEWYLARTDKNE